MRTATLLKRSLTHCWRTNLAVVAGVSIGVAVLAGALLVGDSVGASLRDLFLLRLGRVDHAISSSGFFREKLAVDLQLRSRFSEAFRAACPLIMLEGLVRHQESGRRGSGVRVYGVDERFWKFHGDPGARRFGNGEVFLSSTLGQELGSETGDFILVTIQKPEAVPAEWLHGRKGSIGSTIRLNLRGILPASALGEFSIHPQQGQVRAVFVPLRRLQQELGLEGKVNTILVSERDPRTDAASAARLELLGKLLKDTFTLEDLGIQLSVLEKRRSLVLESDGGLVGDPLAQAARATANRLRLHSSAIFTYLANSIRSGSREIPYSLVTAIDRKGYEQLQRGATRKAPQPSPSASLPAPSASLPTIVLNDWSARDLAARVGQIVSLEYYVWEEQGRLLTRRAQFQLTGIVPIEGAAGDPDLAPQYPGITDSDNLGDWAPPFPIDLGRIRHQDEQYWDQYGTTPKAFVRLETGQELWQSRFGKLTSLRLFVEEPAVPPTTGSGSDQLQAALKSYRKSLKTALDPVQMGFSISAVRVQGLQASRGATDFGEYFLYFSFFLVISALLLTGLFFKLGVEQRLAEIGILRAIGFPSAKIRALFLKEGLTLATAGSLLGLVGALAYGWLIMHGLRTWWAAAVGTRLLTLHISFTSLVLGGVGGILMAIISIAWTLRGLRPTTPRGLLSGTVESARQSASKSQRAFWLGAAFSLLGCVLLVSASRQWIEQVAGFFGAGIVLLLALLSYQWGWLVKGRRSLLSGSGVQGMSRLGFRNTTHRPGRSILSIALIASATFIIVAVGAFRPSEPAALDPKSGTGGFPLLAESLLPVHYDLNTDSGKEGLNLSVSETSALEKVTFVPFRLKPGDDASCLNLYRPQNPRILAASSAFIRNGRFSFQKSLASTPEEKENPWLLLETEQADGAIPAIADFNSMEYVLHLKLGDEFLFERETDRPVRMRMVGALADSVFQRELLISEKHFLRLFPDQQGSRFFLLDMPSHQVEPLTGVLEEGLADYGFDVVSTEGLLAAFHRVENTYISTFQTLGGLGLLLGTLGLAVVLLRNVLERRRELALLRALGFRSADLGLIVIAENALLLFGGLVTGAVSALLAIVPPFFIRGSQFPALSLCLTLLAVLVTGVAASVLATMAAIRSPLLPALRAE